MLSSLLSITVHNISPSHDMNNDIYCNYIQQIDLYCSNWLGASAETDAFGKALISSGLSTKTIADWSVDPRVTLPGGEKGSIFDALEDMDVDDVLAKLVELNGLNADTI